MADLDDLDAVRAVVAALSDFERSEQERILRWAMEKLGIGVAAQPAVPLPAGAAVGVASRSPIPLPATGNKDIKSFVSEKSPSSDNQFAATVAYYYMFEAPEEERQESINSSDLQEACRKVGRSRLGDPGKTLRNAHNMGYIDKAERGSYKINTVGENLIAVTLPSGTSGGSKNLPTKRKRKKANKKKTKKKAKKISKKRTKKVTS